MAKKNFNVNKRSKPMSEVIQEFESSEDTQQAALAYDAQPSIENHVELRKKITADVQLGENKKIILQDLEDSLIEIFSNDSMPTQYDELKRQSRQLAVLHQTAGIFMASRLSYIRDNELYTQDGYAHFKDFIANEIPMEKSSVYNYIDLFELFLKSKRLDSKIKVIANNRSKLIPFFPLLKSNSLDSTDKDRIKNDVVNSLETKSFRDFKDEATKLKQEFNLIQSKNLVEKKSLSQSLLEYIKSSSGEFKELENLVSYLHREKHLSEVEYKSILQTFS